MILNYLSLRIMLTALLAFGLYPCSSKEKEVQSSNACLAAVL